MPALDEYIARFAEQHRRRSISSVYVQTDSARPEFALGYYTPKSMPDSRADAPSRPPGTAQCLKL